MDHQRQLQLLGHNYLRPQGWFASLEACQSATPCSVDNHGPTPWFTYPAMEQLRRMAKPYWRVFEYGCGGSTLWWASRVAQVVSVEHDPAWARAVRERLPANAELRERPMHYPVDHERYELVRQDFLARGFDWTTPQTPLGNDPLRHYRAGNLNAPYAAYASTILDYPREHFHVVVVDGAARPLTAWFAARMVHSDGLVIFDNADRDEYRLGYELLEEAGFTRIDFHGPGPINDYAWTTAFFLRTLKPLSPA